MSQQQQSRQATVWGLRRGERPGLRGRTGEPRHQVRALKPPGPPGTRGVTWPLRRFPREGKHDRQLPWPLSLCRPSVRPSECRESRLWSRSRWRKRRGLRRSKSHARSPIPRTRAFLSPPSGSSTPSLREHRALRRLNPAKAKQRRRRPRAPSGMCTGCRTGPQRGERGPLTAGAPTLDVNLPLLGQICPILAPELLASPAGDVGRVSGCEARPHLLPSTRGHSRMPAEGPARAAPPAGPSPARAQRQQEGREGGRPR